MLTSAPSRRLSDSTAAEDPIGLIMDLLHLVALGLLLGLLISLTGLIPLYIFLRRYSRSHPGPGPEDLEARVLRQADRAGMRREAMSLSLIPARDSSSEEEALQRAREVLKKNG